MGLVASASCNFVKLDDDNILRLGGIDAIGFWCYEQVGSGSRYEYGDFLENRWDDSFEVARSLGLTANCIGFVVWLFYLLAACLPMPSPFFLGVGCLCMCACMFEGFKFWILQSSYFCDGDNRGCSLDTGGRCSISAVVFWFVAFLMACAHGKERMGASKDNDDAPAEEEAPQADEEEDKKAAEEQPVEQA